jgi:hypothetical protein
MFKRFPSFSEIVPVYAVVAFMLFSWSILQFFWYLPSWLFFMRLGDLVGVFCYVMVSSFFEGLTFLCLLLLLSFSLPAKYLKDEFVVRGTSMAISAIGLLMLYFYFNISKTLNIPVVWYGIAVILVTVVISFLSTKVRFMRQVLTWFSDRLTVFLYILIPLSVLSLFVIIVRNIV